MAVYTFRQSSLNELLLCMERYRLGRISGIEEETDATAIGTAMHAGIELYLTSEWGAVSLGQMTELAFAKFDELAELPHFQWVQVKTAETAKKHLSLALEGWYRDVRPILGEPVHIERTFNIELDRRGDDIIRITGTVDFEDDEPRLWDWKTSKDERKYKTGWGGDGWKLQRFAPQPTVYAAARYIETGKVMPFTFAAVTKGTSTFQYVDCERTEADFEWLKEQLWSYVEHEQQRGLDTTWPKNDQHALCSETWCPFWSACKGKHHGP